MHFVPLQYVECYPQEICRESYYLVRHLLVSIGPRNTLKKNRKDLRRMYCVSDVYEVVECLHIYDVEDLRSYGVEGLRNCDVESLRNNGRRRAYLQIFVPVGVLEVFYVK